MKRLAAIARRELGAFVGSPAAWWVVAGFLLAQGYAFWAVVKVLADPRRPAPYGAVLRTSFGGTYLYWTLLVGFVVALTMRLVAEEKRSGTFDVLASTPVADATIVLGKWLGALAFYAILWAPTLLYPLVLAAYAPPGAGLDGGPVASAYLGVLVTGASFLAVGVAASAASAHQLVAAVIGFVILQGLLLVGSLPEMVELGPLGGRVVAALDVRRHMDDFARGVIDSRHLAVHAGLTVAALTAATLLLGAPRRPRAQWTSSLFGWALVAAAALLVNVEAARHPLRADVTRTRFYTLEAKTRQILADVHVPVRVLVLRAEESSAFAELYDVVDELLGRFAARQPLVQIERVDPALEPGRAAELAATYQLVDEEVREGGLVVFEAEGRHQGVALLDIASWEGESAGGKLREFRGEAAFAAALLAVSDPARTAVCLVTGHGELPLTARPDQQDVAALARTLAADGVTLSELADLSAGVPPRCQLLAVLGPRERWSASEALAFKAYLDRGGRALVAVDPHIEGAAIAPTGLETVLAEAGVRLAGAIAVDPERSPGIPLSFGTLWGYADHPVTAGFAGRRATYWFAPRVVEPVGADAVALVRTSDGGWGESDLAGLRGERAARDERDLPGPVSVAVAARRGEARLVVLGSARTLTSEVVDRHLGSSDLLAASAIAWLSGRDKLAGVAAKTPEQLRLALDSGQSRRLFVFCVVVLPLLAALGGVWALWRRRRWG